MSTSRRIAAWVAPYRRWVLLASVLTGLACLVNLAIPLLVQGLVDAVVTPAFEEPSIRETLGPLTTGARLVLSPTGELADPRRLLERVREQGVTVLVASHDLNLIERFGMRRVILEGGRAAGGSGAPPPDLPSMVAV